MERMKKAPLRETSRRGFLKESAGVGASAAIISAIGQAGFSADALADDKVRVGYLPVNVMLPVYAKGVGFWKKAGLDVELYRAPGGPAILQALASGSVPVGDIGIGPAIVAATRGLPFYYLTLASVMTPSHPLDRIMVKKDSPIQKFTDLKGKTLAINQRGTMPDAALGAAKAVFGLAKSDIKIVPIPYPNMAQVLQQGQVDAIYPFPPADAVAEVRFGARTIAQTVDLVPYIGFTTLAVRRDFADANPSTIKKLIKGAIVGQRWNNDNRAEALKISNDFLRIPNDVGPKVRTAYWARNALPVMASVWHLYTLQVVGKIIKPHDDIDKIMRSYFIDPIQKFTLPALEEIGIEPDPVIKSMLGAKYPLLPKPVEAYHTEWDKKLLSL